MKRIASLVLVLMLAFSAVCAVAEDKVEMTFMSWQPNLNFMNDVMIPEMNEVYPEYSVEPQVLDWFAFWDKMTIELSAGEGADILGMDDAHLATYEDYLMPLDDLLVAHLGENWKDGFAGSAYSMMYSGVDGEHTYIIPSDVTGCWYLFYNKSMCDELGVAVPNGSYADLVRFVNEVAAADPSVIPVAFAAQENDNIGFLYSWLVSNIEYGIVEKAVKGEAAFTDEAFVKAFDQIKQLYADKILDDRNFALSNYPGCDDAFKNRGAAAYLTGQWSMGAYMMGGDLSNTKLQNDDVGMIKLENVAGGETILQEYIGFGYSINKNCENPDEAFKVILEWVKGDAGNRWANYQGCLPGWADISISADQMRTEEARNTYGAVLDSLAVSRNVSRSTNVPALDTKIGEVVTAVLLQGMSVEDALTQVEDLADYERD